MKNVKKIEDSKLWKQTETISKELYEVIDQVPEEESYPIKFKLKQYALDIGSWTAEGVGSIDPRDAMWQYGKARSALFGARNSYKNAAVQKFIDLKPEVMVLIEEATDGLDKAIEIARADIPKWFEEMGSPLEGKK